MAAQVQQSLLSKKLGAKLTQAHKQYKDAPAEFGNARLPDGIESGIAQLVDVKIGEYKEGENKGQPFFMAAGIVVEPRSHNGVTISGMRTQIGPIPLCDTPKSQGKKKTFADHYADFLNEMKKLGVDTAHIDGTPDQVDAALNAAMVALRTSKPHFKFRTWKGKATPAFPNPRVTEEWNGVCEYNGHVDPATNGVVDNSNAALQPEPFTEPPQGVSENNTGDQANGDVSDPADIVTALLEIINADNGQGSTQECVDAMQQLGEMAAAAGATEEQIQAASWDEVANMALGVMPEPVADPVKGGVYNFRKRDSKGNPLTDKAGKEFPPQEIEVVSVDAAKKTVTAKTKDGKMVQGIGQKTPTAIKWEWLE